MTPIPSETIEPEQFEYLRIALDKHVIIAITDHQGVIRYVNDKFCEVSQYSRAELIGKPHSTIRSGHHPEAFFKAMWETISSGHTWRGEIKNRAKDGSYYWVDMTITPIAAPHESPRQDIAIDTDITARKKALAIVENYAAIIESSIDGIIGINLEGIITSWNSGAHNLFGYSAEEMTGSSILRIIPPHLIPEEDLILSKVRRGEYVEHFETVRCRKDSTSVDVSVSLSPIKDSFGNTTGASIIIRDITEQLRAKLALKESEKRFRNLAETIKEVFWITDPDKRHIIYVSPAYEQIWGRTCNSLYEDPESWFNAIHQDDKERLFNSFRANQLAGFYDERFRIIRPDGEIRWIHDRAYPMKELDGTVSQIVGIAQDITAEYILESQLRQAQKMEAMGTLAGGIAHDFNNVLGAMSGYIELSKHRAHEDAKLMSYLDEVAKAGKRAADLVAQILTFSRQEEQEKKPMLLSQVIYEVAALLKANLPSSVALSLDVSPDSPVIIGNSTQIHQVLMNLCTNAWQAMQDQPGILKLTLETAIFADERSSKCLDLSPGEYALLKIRDDGSGMSPEVLERIFDPFFTTKPPGEGTGLGLSVAHGIIKSHEGRIIAESSPGEGSLFSIYFPAAPVSQISETHPDNELIAGSNEKILFIDDEIMLCHVAKDLLEIQGYSVDIETNGLRGLATISENPSLYDLVMTDYTMPEILGTDLARKISDLVPSIRIILMTGYAPNLKRINLIPYGIDELIHKPFSFTSLHQVVKKVLTLGQK